MYPDPSVPEGKPEPIIDKWQNHKQKAGREWEWSKPYDGHFESSDC